MDPAKKSGTASWLFDAIKRATSFDITFISSDVEEKQSASGNILGKKTCEGRVSEVIVSMEVNKSTENQQETPKKSSKTTVGEKKQQIVKLRQVAGHNMTEFLTIALQQHQTSNKLKCVREQLESDFERLTQIIDLLQVQVDRSYLDCKVRVIEEQEMEKLHHEIGAMRAMFNDNSHCPDELPERIRKLGEDLQSIIRKRDLPLETPAQAPSPPSKISSTPPKLPDKPGQLDGLDLVVWETALKQLKMMLEQPKEKTKKVKSCENCHCVYEEGTD